MNSARQTRNSNRYHRLKRISCFLITVRPDLFLVLARLLLTLTRLQTLSFFQAEDLDSGPDVDKPQRNKDSVQHCLPDWFVVKSKHGMHINSQPVQETLSSYKLGTGLFLLKPS